MIQMLTSVIGQRGVDAMAFLLAFALTALTETQIIQTDFHLLMR